MQAPEDIIEATLGTIVDEIGFRPEDNISTTHTLRGFEDYRDMPNITRGLVARGYDDEQIAGILGENFMRCVRGGVRVGEAGVRVTLLGDPPLPAITCGLADIPRGAFYAVVVAARRFVRVHLHHACKAPAGPSADPLDRRASASS